MCVICIAEHSKPSLITLEDMELSNPHGMGLAFREGSRVVYAKGLTADDCYAIDPPLPAVYHARIATEGGISKNLCHPFPVGGSRKVYGKTEAVVFHNGHWWCWHNVLTAVAAQLGASIPPGEWSDSRAIAYLAGLLGPSVCEMVGETGDKVVYFSGSKLERFGSWKRYDGMMFSNLDFNMMYYPISRPSSKFKAVDTVTAADGIEETEYHYSYQTYLDNRDMFER